MKKDLRFLLAEPFGGLTKETLNELEASVKHYTADVIKYTIANMFNGNLTGLKASEIIEKYESER